MKAKRIIVALVLLLVLTAGCARYPAAPQHEVFYSEQISVVNGTFVMDGEYIISQGSAPDATFRDTRVVLYDEQHRVLEEIPLGDMSTDSDVAPSARSVNITSVGIPEYVVYESPNFWRDSDVATTAFKRSDEDYTRYYITDFGEKFDS